MYLFSVGSTNGHGIVVERLDGDRELRRHDLPRELAAVLESTLEPLAERIRALAVAAEVDLRRSRAGPTRHGCALFGCQHISCLPQVVVLRGKRAEDSPHLGVRAV